MGLFSRKTETDFSTPKIDVPAGFEVPPKTRWAHAPDLLAQAVGGDISGTILTGTELAPCVNLHHDAENAHIEIRKTDTGTEFRFGQFNGSFLSLAMGIPEAEVCQLDRNSLVRLAIHAICEQPFQAYARLNLVYGPNTEKLVRMIDFGRGDSFVEFDIFYSEFDHTRVSGAWIDLIFNTPQDLAFTLSNVVLLRRIRASL